jgi:hypothetical protein
VIALLDVLPVPHVLPRPAPIGARSPYSRTFIPHGAAPVVRSRSERGAADQSTDALKTKRTNPRKLLQFKHLAAPRERFSCDAGRCCRMCLELGRRAASIRVPNDSAQLLAGAVLFPVRARPARRSPRPARSPASRTARRPLAAQSHIHPRRRGARSKLLRSFDLRCACVYLRRSVSPFVELSWHG